MDSPEQMRAELGRAGLSRHSEALIDGARFGVRIEAERCSQDQLPLGASRFGGLPDLPSDFDWPTHEGKPHTFLAQIDLSKLPPGSAPELPSAGWLVFFYECETMKWGFDPADRGCALVRHIAATEPLQRREPPPSNEPTDAPHPCRLSLVPTLYPLDPVDDRFAPIESQLSKREHDAYVDFAGEDEAYGSCHHLLGQPQIVQSGMRLECQLVTNGVYCGDPDGYRSDRAQQLADGWRDWELLLQINTDEEGPGWMWGDDGCIYFWMRRDDLRAGNFERAWLILQCG